MTEAPGSALVVELASDTQIRMTRMLNAPRALVFETLTKPEHIRQWWGPRSMTMVSCEVDLRVGGAWRFVQRDPDGGEYAFRGEYREISPPDRLTYTFEFEEMPGHVSVEDIFLTEAAGKTTLVNVVTYASREERDAVIESGMESGARESMDRLEELLHAVAGA